MMKIIWKITICLHDKSSKGTKNKVNIPQNNEVYIRQRYRQHHTKGEYKSISSKVKNEIRCLLSHLLFNIVLGAIRQEIDIKGVKEIRLSLFGDNMILY